MNDLKDELLNILSALDRSGLLKHLVLVGSWVLVIYEDYFNDRNYSPTIRTTDVDFLLPGKKVKVPAKIDVSKILGELGFSELFSPDGWLTYHKPELHIEFLLPRIGAQTDSVVSIPRLGINARPIRHLSVLGKNTISVNFHGHDVFVPHPAAYALQKLIIFPNRKNREKAQKDLDQVETIFSAMTNPSDIDLMRSLFGQLTKKQKQAVLNSAKKRVLIEDFLQGTVIGDVRDSP